MFSEFIAISWGSTNFRAQLINDESGIADHLSLPAGIAKIDRTEMAKTLRTVVAKWPEAEQIYASGMIGSSVGWMPVDYARCPADLSGLAGAMTRASIGNIDCHIVPGLCCKRLDGDPDIMRGEEIEIFGLLKHQPQFATGEHIVVLPGTHTKWAKISDGRVVEFYTSMTGELFDHLSAHGLLASLLEGKAMAGASFEAGVAVGVELSSGFGRALFGVRAKAIMGELTYEAAPSYLRGLLIGAEIADALLMYPEIQTQNELILVGNKALSLLYVAALKALSITGRPIEANVANAHGFSALHACLQSEAVT